MATLEEIEAVHETDSALLCTDHAGWETWVPKSVIHDDSEVWELGTSGTLVLHGWWAEKNGLELD